MGEDFIASSWSKEDFVLHPYWIVGFTEADGSFYITKKSDTRLVHGFGWTQKYDSHVLEALRVFFKIKAKVRRNSKGFWI